MIERRNKGGNVWTKCNMTPVPTLNYNAAGLTEGQTYEFRVMAVNAAGLGKPSNVSQPQVAKEPICKLICLNSSNLISIFSDRTKIIIKHCY